MTRPEAHAGVSPATGTSSTDGQARTSRPSDAPSTTMPQSFDGDGELHPSRPSAAGVADIDDADLTPRQLLAQEAARLANQAAYLTAAVALDTIDWEERAAEVKRERDQMRTERDALRLILADVHAHGRRIPTRLAVEIRRVVDDMVAARGGHTEAHGEPSCTSRPGTSSTAEGATRAASPSAAPYTPPTRLQR